MQVFYSQAGCSVPNLIENVLFPPSSKFQNRRVAVTGVGITTALGQGWGANLEGFREGRTAFREVSLFDVSKNRARAAAEITSLHVPATRLSGRSVGRLDRAGKMLLAAAAEAWHQSGWNGTEFLPVVFGTTGGGMSQGEQYYQKAIGEKADRLQKRRVVNYQAQRQGHDLGAAFGFTGPQTIIANACASGANAVGHAFDLVRSGQHERVLAAGYDAISQMIFCGFDSLQALSTTNCRPFDKSRDGLALGEGAGVLCLEPLEDARKRGAEILGEITGYASTIDLHHLTQPHPKGDAAYIAMERACAMAKLKPGEIDYINAHGTATPLNDASELLAINRLGGNEAGQLQVSSTKASVGHLLGGAGAVEAVICLMTLREGFLPPMLATQEPDPGCLFKLVTEPVEKKVRNVLSNSFGFGGANASLAFRRFE